MLDIDRLRSDTAGCDEVLHFNNAGSSLPPRPVVDAMVDYLRAEARCGGYEIAADRAGDLDLVYQTTARYLNCSPAEVAFTGSAADGWWRAFSAIDVAPGDRILVGTSEYQANAFGWLQAVERGAVVDVVPNDDAGTIDPDAFESLLDERVKLVSLTMIAMSNGAIHPAAELGRRLRASGSEAIYLLDACQAAGQLRLDVTELGCDFLNYTGRKFMRGPRGTGILYASSQVLERLGRSPSLDGRSATWTTPTSYQLAPGAMRFEFGEFGYAAKVGLGVATAYLLDVGVDEIASRVQSLAARLRDDLASIDGVRVLDQGVDRCGIVTFDLAGTAPAVVQTALRARNMNVSALTHTLAQLDLGSRSLDAVVRASVHYFNTDEEIERFCTAVAAVVAGS